MIKKILIISGLTVLFLLFVSLGLLGWFQGKNMPILDRVVTVPILEKNAADVMGAVQQNMSSLQTAKYDLEIIVKPVKSQSIRNVKFSALFDGKVGQALLGQLHLGASIEINNLTYLSSAEFRFAENQSYFRLTDVPALNFINMSAIENRWYTFKSSDIAGPNGGEWTNVGQSIKTSTLITGYERKPDEQINGQTAYRFDVKLSPSALSQLVDLTAHAAWPGPSTELLKKLMSGQQCDMATIWIGKENLLLYQIAFRSHGTDSELDAKLFVDGFNQEVAIEQPGDAEPISSLPRLFFGETNFLDWPLFGYQLGLDLSKSTVDADKDGLYEIWEDIFGTDPNISDSDHDGFVDGVEVRGGYNPMGSGKFMANW